MPDIDFQKIELNLIPKKGDEPVIFYASQYETARPFIAVLKWGDTEFAPDDCWAEIDIRKNDNNLVVITDDVTIINNEVSVVLPVQALTCIGKNLGQVKIYSADDKLIAALNFILEVQPDPLAGGVDSETAIDNLESQIAAIVPEVIGEDYYDKTEVDNLLADKADVSDLPDMTNYYTKTQTDTLLNAKADASTTYTKTEVDNALALKANSSDLATVATTGDYDDLINKPVLPDMTQYYTKSEVNAIVDDLLPVVSDSGAMATIDVGLERALKTITVDPLATQVVHCGMNLWSFEDSYTIAGAGYLINAESFLIKAGTYNFNYSTELLTGATAFSIRDNEDNVLTTIYVNNGTNNGSFTIAADGAKLSFYSNIAGTYSDIQINSGSGALSYEEYNGHTYPVADIDQITTFIGENNIYANAGDVSVSAYDSIQHYIDNQ